MEAILFDLDGTLVDTSTMLHAAYEDVLTENGLSYEKNQINGLIGMGLVPIYQKLSGDDERGLELAEQHRQHIRSANPRVQLFPGMKELVIKLADKGLRLGVVTSAGRPAIERSIVANEIDQFFGTCITSDDVSRLKPHPEPVEAALKELEISPDKAVFVGDSSFDILAGKAAGVRTIGVTWGYGTFGDLETAGANSIVNDSTELQDTIESLLSSL